MNPPVNRFIYLKIIWSNHNVRDIVRFFTVSSATDLCFMSVKSTGLLFNSKNDRSHGKTEKKKWIIRNDISIDHKAEWKYIHTYAYVKINKINIVLHKRLTHAHTQTHSTQYTLDYEINGWFDWLLFLFFGNYLNFQTKFVAFSDYLILDRQQKVIELRARTQHTHTHTHK